MTSLRECAFFALILGSTMAAAKDITVPLDYRKTSTDEGPAIDVTGLSNVRLTIGTVTDKREKPDLLGENVEGDRIPVKVSGSVPDFVKSVLRKELTGHGFNVVDGGSGPILDVDVLNLWVEEGDTYKGQARVKLTVKDSQGKELWSGTGDGSSTRFGRSKKPENYNETISDSLFEAIRSLMANTGFTGALRK